jgi:hypothetical protein
VTLVLCLPAAVAPLAPQVAWAGPAVEDPGLAEARELYAKGKAAYETFQYETAIDLWTEAYGKLPADQAGIRNRMVYNIATAQEKQYDIDKNLDRLRQAVLLLETWSVNFKAMYKATAETRAEVERAEARIAELRDRIAAIERGEDPGAQPPGSAPEDTEAADEDDAGGVGKAVGFESDFDVPPEVLENRRRIAAENKAQGLIAGGWASLGVGFLFTVAGAGAIIGLRDNRFGLAGGVTGTIIGVGLMATGGALLGIGYKKRKRVEAGDYSVVPTFGPRGGGLAVVGRF